MHTASNRLTSVGIGSFRVLAVKLLRDFGVTGVPQLTLQVSNSLRFCCHSELRVPKPKSGEHGRRTTDEAVAVIDTMATRWSDQDIAATLNRMGLPTGQGKTWTANRVSSLRRVRGINAYRSAEKNGEWLTMSEAAVKLRVSNHQLRRL